MQAETITANTRRTQPVSCELALHWFCSQNNYHQFVALPLLCLAHSTLHTYYTCTPRFRLYITLHTLHFTLHALRFTLSTPLFTLLTPHSTLFTFHFALLTPHSTLYTLHSALYTPLFTLYTLYCALYTLHCSSSTLYVLLGYPEQPLRAKASQMPHLLIGTSVKHDTRYCYLELLAFDPLSSLNSDWYCRVWIPSACFEISDTRPTALGGGSQSH